MLKFIGFHRRLTGFRTKSCLVPAAAKGGKPTESIMADMKRNRIFRGFPVPFRT
ncbi:hypothetical protein HMPREF0682_0813 [Propionibacterium acidifaciens F0233]|uniref:Uncharacterized protein n=1 Tax=Propionibacterium acidifaciens F0233 TaxID=553198 RepID=U2QD30_9ACTN|nr:hypothetical protein HMPREF0682_0813 [Propionibacterium acidifaciens F0233]